MSRKLQVFELCGNEYEYLYAKQFYGLILYFHRRQSKIEEIGSDGGFFNVRRFFFVGKYGFIGELKTSRYWNFYQILVFVS